MRRNHVPLYSMFAISASAVPLRRLSEAQAQQMHKDGEVVLIWRGGRLAGAKLRAPEREICCSPAALSAAESEANAGVVWSSARIKRAQTKVAAWLTTRDDVASPYPSRWEAAQKQHRERLGRIENQEIGVSDATGT